MGSLKCDVLLKLLEDMNMAENESEDDRKPVLLQIRSIIPVLEEGDLWPNRGFFLKVSDLSHALYVSLPQEQNEMILGNKLKLGQFIYVRKLENAHPVPLLRGVTPVPGRRQCEGTPEDIVSPENLVKILEASGVDNIVEKGVISEKKISNFKSNSLMCGLSDSDSLREGNRGLKDGYRSRFRSLSPSRKYPRNVRKDKCNTRIHDYGNNIGEEGTKSRPSSVDNDSDTDSVISYASSTSISKRRSWNDSEILGVKDIFDSSVAKHEIRPPARSRSANVSPVRSIRYDSSDENFSSVARRRSDIGSAKRSIKRPNKSQASAPKINNVHIPNSLCSFTYDRKGGETGILWNYLPSSLVQLGKEVIKQRDIAILAATDALQEACAAERLLRSLSMFSEFPWAEEEHQPCVDKFFELQDDLARTRLIMQSLTSISPIRTQDSGSLNTNSIKEALSIALERKKSAATWIKSAVAVDLSTVSSVVDPLSNPVASTVKKSSTSSQSTKPKVTCISKKSTSNAKVPLLFASERDDQNEWTKGSTLTAANDLAASLHSKSRKLFLNDVEKYLDEVEQKCSSAAERENSTAGMIYRVKKVSDWLDLMVNKEGNLQKDGGRLSPDDLGDSEIEICGRLRNKIYGILMKHIERTAMCFDTNKN